MLVRYSPDPMANQTIGYELYRDVLLTLSKVHLIPLSEMVITPLADDDER